MRGPLPFSPVMVPKVVLLLIGLEVFGLLRIVWLSTSKYSMRNSTFISRTTGKVRTSAPFQTVKPGPRSDPLTTLPKPVPGPVLAGTEKAALLSQLTHILPAWQ